MATLPTQPKIYHITHVDNLAGIFQAGRLWSDAQRIALNLETRLAGLSDIKNKRLKRWGVHCYSGTMVGDYVPFYFCPRSIMLYIFHKKNHPDLTYFEGQEPMVHLEADLLSVVEWAEANRVNWAFSNRNAATSYTDFFRSLDDLGEVNWAAMENPDFRDSEVKEGKQAEFLMHKSFPWELVEKIGVHNSEVQQQVQNVLSTGRHSPPVIVERTWYY